MCQIVEPSLNLTALAPSSSSGVAGDLVTLSLELSHFAASDSPAYDLNFNVPFPSAFTFSSASVTVLSGSLPSSAVINSVAGDAEVDVDLAQLPLGTRIRITYVVAFQDVVVAGQSYSLDRTLLSHSAPLTSAVFRAYTSTGSTSLTARTPSVASVVSATSEPQTTFTSSSFDAALGETVEITSTVTLIPGTQPLTVTVASLAGDLRLQSTTVVSIGSGVVTSTLLLAAADSATSSNTTHAVFEFGSAVLSSDASTIVVRVVYKVENNPTVNVADLALSIRSTLDYALGTSVSTRPGTVRRPGPIASMSCAPQGSATWTALRAGDDIKCSIEVRHNTVSTATAFNVRLP